MGATSSQRLTAEQRLQQRLTPLQVQFVRMLEMPVTEAEEEVRRALDEMPALEAVDSDGLGRSGSDEDHTDGMEAPFTESARDMQMADYASPEEVPDAMLSDSRALGPYNVVTHGNSRDADFPAYPEPSTGNGDEGSSLYEALNSQLAQTEGVSTEDLTIGRYIIGNLDDNGYLSRDLAAIADDVAISEGLDVPYDRIRDVYDMVRGLEPAGVGAVDLRDCLILQLRRLSRSAEVLTAIEIVTHYFDLFSKKHFDRIRAALGISPDNLRDALGVITRLNPKPGALLGSGGMAGDAARHITPDFVVEADEDSGMLTLTMPSHIPELRVEHSFSEEAEIPMGAERGANDTRLFIRRNRMDARNFIRLVAMRRETLYRVMASIMKLQREFFLSGDEAMIKPMVLRDIAALTGYDLSVISRAAQGKYVATSTGIYPLKYFFNERTKDDPDAATSHAVSLRIRQIIEGEDKASPLSDEQITSVLTAEGMDIARRTVAKYRERMGIPVARLRREM